MARIIEAKAVIAGEEKLSPILDKLAKKFDAVQKTAKGTEGIEKTATALASVRKQMEAIDRYSSSGAGFARARENYAKAKEGVLQAARAMEKGEGDAKKLARAYAQAQREVRSASAEFERQSKAAIADKRALDELGISANKIVETQSRIASAVDKASAAMERQQKRSEALRKIGEVAGNIAMLAGPGVLHATGEATKAGATLQHEIVKMRAACIPEAEIQAQVGVSADMAAKYPNVARADVLESYKELRSVLSKSSEAPELLDIAIKTRSALNALDPSGNASGSLQFAYKAAEVEGMAQDPKRFQSAMDAFVKAYQVMGKTINPEMILTGAQQLKASAGMLSDRFKWTTYLSMLQEMGPRAGAGVNQVVSQLLGNFKGQNGAAKEFVRLGLARRGDFDVTKAGEVKNLKPGRHVEGWKTGISAPDWYVNDYLIPAMERHGITSLQDQIAESMILFPNKQASSVIAKLIQQRASFENHAKLYHAAPGVNATLDVNRHDPFAGLNSLTTSLESFASTVTGPTMNAAAVTLDYLARGIGALGAGVQRLDAKHPLAAELAGGAAIAAGGYFGTKWTYNLATGFLGGFGLKSSAAALDGSAAALTAAAEALGGAGVAGKVAKAAETAAPAAAASIWARGAMSIPYVGAAVGLGAGLYQLHEQAVANHGTTIHQRRGSLHDIYTRAFNEERAAMGLPLIGQDKPVQAELHGQAEVKGEAKVTITIPGLGDRDVRVPLRGTVNANGPGSLGVSSPDAGAPGNGLGHR